MQLIVAKEAKPEMLKQLLSKAMTLRLYINDVVEGPFVEAAFPGYLPIRLEPKQWVIADSRAHYEPETLQIFTADGDSEETVYGYFVTQGKKLKWSERFAEPFAMKSFGDEVRIQPVFGLE